MDTKISNHEFVFVKDAGVPRERSLFHSRRRGVFGIASGESLIIQAHELLHPVLTRASGGAVSGTDAGIATVPIAEEIRVSYAEDSRTSTTGSHVICSDGPRRGRFIPDVFPGVPDTAAHLTNVRGSRSGHGQMRSRVTSLYGRCCSPDNWRTWLPHSSRKGESFIIRRMAGIRAAMVLLWILSLVLKGKWRAVVTDAAKKFTAFTGFKSPGTTEINRSAGGTFRPQNQHLLIASSERPGFQYSN
ncbi:hypothetical protein Bbelb_134000 [Branchiostoma belcheri]|nr:hypothetical protein Bbelb_134000 [Branchiostoma belcheri]